MSSKKSCFENGFEFTVGNADVADEKGNGWRVSDDVLEMVSKRQVHKYNWS